MRLTHRLLQRIANWTAGLAGPSTAGIGGWILYVAPDLTTAQRIRLTTIFWLGATIGSTAAIAAVILAATSVLVAAFDAGAAYHRLTGAPPNGRAPLQLVDEPSRVSRLPARGARSS